MIYISAFLLGPVAAAAAAIGSALADMAGGYAVYIPATLIIKALWGLFSLCSAEKGLCAVCRRLRHGRRGHDRRLRGF
jgi:uncharacterized membrane protein